MPPMAQYEKSFKMKPYPFHFRPLSKVPGTFLLCSAIFPLRSLRMVHLDKGISYAGRLLGFGLGGDELARQM